jgi:hypothetical protein
VLAAGAIVSVVSSLGVAGGDLLSWDHRLVHCELLARSTELSRDLVS